MTPKVSIIIPCYNKVAYVAAAIESALGQAYPCEVIVVDDGSTDGSLDVVKRFEERITLITGPNHGGCAARNTGVKVSTGDYLQFLDADDILPSDKVSKQIAALSEAPEGSLALCPWHVLHDDGRLDPPNPRAYWRSYDDGLSLLLDLWSVGGYFPPHVWLIPRGLAETNGPWNIALAADQDGEYFGRLLTLATPIVFCSQAHVHYRSPPAGAVSRDRSRRAGESRLMAFEVVAERILAIRDDRAARKACLSRICRTAYALSEFDDMIAQAASWEKRLSVFAFSPSLPRVARGLVGLLGIERGLQARTLLKNLGMAR